MRFSKLRLLGFKSFVDPTELIITDGLTGVVGPNGCGKSNLLEALRWVMGENRPSAMRGAGMEDVIFNGASTRPARNYAEVTLSLDNTDRLAPAAFNQMDQIEVVRRIVRDAGSAYKVTGKEARARDVQMLFADASTGAHSPALVRQGQISELVNAKPKARRRVLEEAAGISGLYQRRHEAELKLNGTETNLTRVEDVLEQLASQLKTLERQAKQAARYREIAEELRKSEAALLFRRWAEAQLVAQEAETQLTTATSGAGSSEAEASKAARAREEMGEKLPPLREEETIASAVVQRLKVERDSIDDEEARARQSAEALAAGIAQLEQDKAREAALGSDADETISRLDWEKDQLLKASEGHDDAEEEARSKARVRAEELSEKETSLDQATEDLARQEARHQALERRHEEALSRNEKASAEAGAAATAVQTAQDGLGAAKSAYAQADERGKIALAAAKASEIALTDAETARSTAQEEEAETRAALSSAEGAEKTLRAEVSALERLLERGNVQTGQILDKIKVAKGFEAAFGAALTDDLKAPEVDDQVRAGWAALSPYADAAPLPGGAAPLADHIDAPQLLSRRLGTIGLVERADGDRLQDQLKPGQRLVSREGDLWRWDGLRSNADDAPSAATLVLQQRNRLEELKAELDTAETGLAAARTAQEAAHARLGQLSSDERAAREARKAADHASTEALRDAGRSEANLNMLEGQLETHLHLLERRREEAEAAKIALASASTEMQDVGDLSEQRAALEDLKRGVEEARADMLEARAHAEGLRREQEARQARLQEISQEKSGWQLRQETAGTRLKELTERIEAAQLKLETAKTAPDEIAQRREKLSTSIEDAETRRNKAADALSEAETALRQFEETARSAERKASEAREARARAEAVAEAAVAQVASATARIDEELSTTPQALVEQFELDVDKLPAAEKVEMDVARLKRQREAMGAVNLRAEEDAREIQEEHDTLDAEKQDLEAAVLELKRGIDSLNTEGRQRLLDAFDQVNRNFSELFKHLFGGGEASLVLVESDDPLEAGLEIMCQPPGKKLSTLSLLSGGEQTLTAMSLIFAVFMANPSPICVLDEVDAPLDDANVNRFCDLLDEMTDRTDTRFLIITHHPTTMSRMDRLFGVTMAEQGVSQLVSVDLQEAERIVA